MSAREHILKLLRAADPAPEPLPALPFRGQEFADLPARFAAALPEVGGRCVRVRSLALLEQALLAVPEYAAARSVASLVPGVGKANVDLAAIADPHDLRDVDYCVLPGVLGVAESGAVWVTDHGGKNRAVAFLSQHLAIVLPAAALVSNLHQAYEQIALDQPGFALFLSGPSKTADIEQALVIGAHGARSCTVFLLDSVPKDPAGVNP